jgi:iron(II)-dependent oxidoreductase
MGNKYFRVTMKHPAELPEVDPVHLKPFLGMQPGLYLLILYLLLIAAVLFVIGFLPGVVRGGRYVTFQGTLSDSGVYVDDIYLGSTDYQYFIGSGTHQITVRKADIVVTRMTLSIDHPVFFTWLFHRTKRVELPITETLSETDKKAIIRFDLAEIARYSAITTFDSVTVYPPLFANLQTDVEELGIDPSVYGLAGAYITSNEMYQDAKSVTTDDTLFIKELSVAGTLFGEEASNGMAGEPAVLTETDRKRVSLDAGDFTIDGIAYQSATFVMGGETKASYPDVNQAGVTLDVPSFAIATLPVSQWLWARFIQDNPTWAKTNVKELSEQGYVDENYLASLTLTTAFSPTGRPVYNISYSAAQAFCQWLSLLTGKEVFLPSEAQWSLAAQGVTDYRQTLTLDDDGSTTPSSLLGGVWELTDTRYIPLSRLCGYTEIHQLADRWNMDGDVIVKGGSYLNNDITASQVGVVRRDACGDQLGMRIAWMVDNGKN